MALNISVNVKEQYALKKTLQVTNYYQVANVYIGTIIDVMIVIQAAKH